jgi:hypothetical protein
MKNTRVCNNEGMSCRVSAFSTQSHIKALHELPNFHLIDNITVNNENKNSKFK